MMQSLILALFVAHRALSRLFGTKDRTEAEHEQMRTSEISDTPRFDIAFNVRLLSRFHFGESPITVPLL